MGFNPSVSDWRSDLRISRRATIRHSMYCCTPSCITASPSPGFVPGGVLSDQDVTLDATKPPPEMGGDS